MHGMLNNSKLNQVDIDEILPLFRWSNAEQETLSNISLSVTGNKLLMIVGEVGSGKVPN